MEKSTDEKESSMERFFRLTTGKEASGEFKNVLKRASENKELASSLEKLESNTGMLLHFENVNKKIQWTSKVSGKDIVDVLLSTDITTEEAGVYIGFLETDSNLQEINRIRDEIMARFVVGINSATNETDKQEQVRKIEDLIRKFQREKLVIILDGVRYTTFQEGMSHVDTINALLHPPKILSWKDMVGVLISIVVLIGLYVLAKSR